MIVRALCKMLAFTITIGLGVFLGEVLFLYFLGLRMLDALR